MAFIKEIIQTDEQKAMITKVLFTSNSIIIKVSEVSDFADRSLVVGWEAILNYALDKLETITWAKPYENEEIDIKTKKEIIYHLCVELSRLDYIGYKGEYVGDEMRKTIDEIVENRSRCLSVRWWKNFH